MDTHSSVITEVKTSVSLSEKIMLVVMMLGGITAAVAFAAAMTRLVIREPDVPEPPVVLSEQRNAYVPKQVLVKFKKDTVAPEQLISNVLAQPVSVNTVTSGGSVSTQGTSTSTVTPTAKAVGTIFNALPSADKVGSLFPDRAKRVSAGETSPSEIGLDRWWLVEINESNANLFEVLTRFSELDQVEAVQLNDLASATVIPNDPYYSSSNSWGQGYDDLWGLKKINAAQAWDQSKGNGVTIAIIDSGVDYNHADLSGNIWTNSGEIAGNGLDDDGNGLIDDVHGFDYENSIDWNQDGDYLDAGDVKDPDPMDDYGHGTHVAGIAAAVGDNTQGVVGVAYQSKIMPVKSLDETGVGSSENLAKGILYAVAEGADVINNSWAYLFPTPTDPIVEDAVHYAHAQGAVIVFSAGNRNQDVVNYSPQNQSSVITVAATDHLDGKSSYSNWGNRIDFAAPGGGDYDILSPRALGTNSSGYVVGNTYFRKMGTSMAAPHVSGLAALLLAKYPYFSNEDVRAAIRQSAVDLGTPGFDTSFGYGRIDASAAIAISNPVVAHISSPLENSVFIGNSLPILGQASFGGTSQSGQASVTTTPRYTVSFGQGENPSTWTTIYSSNSSASGTLATWDTTNLDGVYTIILNVLGSGGSATDKRTISFGWPASIAKPNDPYFRFSRISTPAFGDIDPSYPGKETVVIASEENMSRTFVYIFHADGSSMVNWNPKVLTNEYYISSLDSSNQTAPAVGDVNNDGQLDIVVASMDKVHVFKADGTDLPGWPKTISDTLGAGPVIADLDGNGTLEVMISSFWDNKFYIWQYDGSTLNASWPKTTTGEMRSSPSVGNLDSDSQLEIVMTEGSMVHIWNINGSELSAAWPKTVSGALLERSTVVADIDQDGNVEVLVGGINSSNQGTLHAFETSGASVAGSWPRTFAGPFDGFAVGNLDPANRNLEIVVAPENSPNVYAINADGSNVQGSWPFVNPFSIIPNDFFEIGNAPVLADINRDGNLDVLVGQREHNVGVPQNYHFFALTSTGSMLDTFPPTHLLGKMIVPPGVADLDGDGNMEVFQPALDGYLHRWEVASQGAPQGLEWPVFAYDALRTGNKPSGSIKSYSVDISSKDVVSGQYGFKVPVYLHLSSSAQTVKAFKFVYHSLPQVMFLNSPFAVSGGTFRTFNDDGLDGPERVEISATIPTSADYLKPGNTYKLFDLLLTVGGFTSPITLSFDPALSSLTNSSGSLINVSSIDYLPGTLGKIATAKGDLNLNGIPNEIGDVVLFNDYLTSGVGVFDTDPTKRQQQIDQSDVNWNCTTLEESDRNLLLSIVTGDSQPMTESHCP